MLAFAILGLAGCAIALIAIALDWRVSRRLGTGWRYTTTQPIDDVRLP